jgi:Tfp pilus assembly protein PilV
MMRTKTRCRRHGVVLLIVLVCLAVAMALVVGWAKIAVLQSRQARGAEDRLQAVWLAESAIERAMARLQIDPDYQGETWQVDADAFGGGPSAGPSAGGVAIITVEPVASNDGARQVTVQADYPLTGHRANRISKQVVVDLPNRGDTP